MAYARRKASRRSRPASRRGTARRTTVKTRSRKSARRARKPARAQTLRLVVEMPSPPDYSGLRDLGYTGTSVAAPRKARF